ncbi:MAG: acetyl-CoA carboxylase biotin carboxyl carrier protein [Eubacteriales bacterium]|nr:acetyl-CoA carboxylase biotin carboxyl carrier protein [Eubacteriales bacterium]
MNHNEIIELIQFFEKSNLEVMEFNQGDTRLYLKKADQAQPPVKLVSSVAVSEDKPSVAEPEQPQHYHKVNSPMVGTFYRAANPEAKPFVEVGDMVKKGDVLCILEAMKMLNEIQADCNGQIVDILVENGSMIDYGKTLFLIEEKNV